MSRFKNEQQGLAYLMHKIIPDPRGLLRKNPIRFKHCKPIQRASIRELQVDFNQWLRIKKFMFSPEEMIRLMGFDHRGRKGMVDQSYRDKIINMFVAWCEGSTDMKGEMIEATKEELSGN